MDLCILKLLYFMLVIQDFVNGATINDTVTLLSDLSANYNKNVRPVNDQSQKIDVNIVLFMKSIQEFDEVQEKFSFVGALGCSWKDDLMTWDPNFCGGLASVTVSYDDVWVPELTLSSPSDKAVNIGKSSDRVRFNQNGISEWIPSSLIQSTCSVNVRYYPFDTQKCTTSFTSLGYKNYEVTLKDIQNTIDFRAYQENSLWKIEGSEVSTKLLSGGGESEIDFTVSLSRKPMFVVVNVLIPILVLSLLNTLVFVLVPESGERIGYCVTTLLAIAVYMTIVSDMLPQTSEPVPLISYKLMMDMMVSSLIVLVTILNMRIHNKLDERPVPKLLQSMYNILSGKRCTKHKVLPQNVDKQHGKFKKNSGVMHVTEIPSSTSQEVLGHNNKLNEAVVHNAENRVTWKMIANMFDWIALVGFTLVSVLSFVIFVAITRGQTQ